MTSNARRRLARLETTTSPAAPFLILSFGLPDDGLYRGEGETTYTAAEFCELEKQYQIVLIKYVDDWPPGEVAT